MDKQVVSWEKYGDLIAAIRAIYIKHGAKLFDTPGELSATMNRFLKSENGEVWFVFYWHSLVEIRTPDGSHPVTGSRVSGDVSAALEELKDRYGLELFQTTERNHERWDYYRALRTIEAPNV